MLGERLALASVRSPFVGVFAGEGAGLDVSHRERVVVDELNRLARTAVAAGARTLILGGAALTGMTNRLSADAHLIDCVEATIRSALATAQAA